MPETPPLDGALDSGSVVADTPTEARPIVSLLGTHPDELTKPAPAVKVASLAEIAGGALQSSPSDEIEGSAAESSGDRTPDILETSESTRDESGTTSATGEDSDNDDTNPLTTQKVTAVTDEFPVVDERASPKRQRLHKKINWTKVGNRLSQTGTSAVSGETAERESVVADENQAPIISGEPVTVQSAFPEDQIPDLPTEPLPTPAVESVHSEIDSLLPSPDADGYTHVVPAILLEDLRAYNDDPTLSDEDFTEVARPAVDALREIFRATIPSYFGYEDAASIPPILQDEFNRFITAVIRYQLTPEEKAFGNEYRNMALGLSAGDNVARQEALAQESISDIPTFARLIETYGRRIPFLLKHPTSDFIANYKAIVSNEYLLEQGEDGLFYFEGIAPYETRQSEDLQEGHNGLLPYEVSTTVDDLSDPERQRLERLIDGRLGDMSHAKMQRLLEVAQAGFPKLRGEVAQSVSTLTPGELAREVARVGAEIDSTAEPEVLIPVVDRIYAVEDTVLPDLFGFKTKHDMTPQVWEAYMRLSKRLIFGFGEKGSMQEALIADALHQLPPMKRGWLARLKHRNLNTSERVNLLKDKMRTAFERDHYFTFTSEGIQHSFFPPLTRPNPATKMEISLPRVETATGFGFLSTADREELVTHVSFRDRLDQDIATSFEQAERQALEGTIYLPGYTIDHLPPDNETTDSENAKLAPETRTTVEGDLTWLEGILHTLYQHPQERASGHLLDKVSLTKPGTFYDEDGKESQDFAPRHLANIIHGGSSFNRTSVLSRFIVLDPTHQENGKVVVLVPRTFAGQPTYSDTGEVVYENVARLRKVFPSWFVEFAVIDGSATPLQKILETRMNASDDAKIIQHYSEEHKTASASTSPEADTEQVPVVNVQPVKQVYTARTPYYRSLILAGEHRVGIVGNGMEITRERKQVFSSLPIQFAAGVYSAHNPFVELPKKRTPDDIINYLNTAETAIDSKWSLARSEYKELALNKPDHTVAYITEGEHKYAVIERTGTALPYVLRNGEVIPLMRNVWVEGLLKDKQITDSQADELSEAMANILTQRDLETVMIHKALQHLDAEIAALGNNTSQSRRREELQQKRATIQSFVAQVQNFGREDSRFEHTLLRGPESLPKRASSKEQRIVRKQLQEAANERRNLVTQSLPKHLSRYLEPYAATLIHPVAEHPRAKTQGVFPVATGELLIISDAPPQIIARAVERVRDVTLLPQAIIKEHQRVLGEIAKPVGAAVLKVT